MSNNLKPCPFCGGEAKLIRTHYGIKNRPTLIVDGWAVYCTKCKLRYFEFESEIFQDDNGEIIIKHDGAKEAIEAWNTRADGPQKGEWIAEYERQGNYSHCSLCECRCAGYVPNYKFCPNCGADMRKEKDNGQNSTISYVL